MTKGAARKTKTTEASSRRKPQANVPVGQQAAGEARADVRAASISHDEIARRAYLLFLERGGQHGDDLADWLRAEAELTAAARRGNGAGD